MAIEKSAYERQQEQLITAHNEKQERIQSLAADLKERYGETFARHASIQIDGMGKESTLDNAVDSIARQLAEKNITNLEQLRGDPATLGRIVDKAVGDAFDKDRAAKEQEPTRAGEQASHQTEPEPGRKTLSFSEYRARDPGRGPEATLEPRQSSGHGLSGSRDYSVLKQEHERALERTEGAGDASGRKLIFSEDRADELGERKSDRREDTREQTEAGGKRLSFSEDRNQAQGHDIEH